MKPAVDSQVQPTVQLAAAAEPAADVAPIPPAPVSPAQNSSVKIDSADRAQRLAERNARVQAKEYKRGKTPLVPDENGQLVSAETVVSQHFPDLRHEISNSSMVFDFDEPEDLKKMIRSLNKVQSKNLVILGEGGSGKTEMVRSFVKAVMNGQVPSFPPSTPFLKVEAAAFEAGGKSAGMIPARINALIKYAQSTGAVIFLDEIHSLKSVGTHSEESNGLFQKIKTAMADGSIRVIGTSTVDEFNEAFGDDEALLRRFQKIVKEAPSMEKSVERMTAWTKSAGFEPLNKELYEKIFTLSEEFDAVGSQPAKAIRLLDEVLTLAKLDNILEEEITTEHLHQAASELYSGIDKSEFDPHFRQKRLNNFQSEMNHRVMGMDQLKEKLFRITKRALAQTHDTGKPRLRVLLPGAKGLGKSHIAASYAKSMGLPYERINMADYAAGKTPEELLGRIKSVLSKHPMTVINFDEVEKAHPSVQNALLELMESDFIKVPTKSQNGSRRYTRLRVSGASIFMTTNAGQDYVTSGATIEREALEAALKADGLSEFLFNRVQVIEPVQPPRTAQEFQSVVRFKLKEKLAEISKKHEVQINLAPAQEQQLLDRLTKEYFHPPGQAKQVTVQTAAGPKAISVTTNYRKAAEDLDDIVGTAVSDVIDHSHVARSKCISLELDHLLSR
jgi:ATP-dependent Clp protease ATP-binding subunit ClpA